MIVLRQFLQDESGATAIEYALIMGGIMLAVLASLNSVGTAITTTFNSVSTALK